MLNTQRHISIHFLFCVQSFFALFDRQLNQRLASRWIFLAKLFYSDIVNPEPASSGPGQTDIGLLVV